MFGSLSFNEILFIMVLALLIFGPKRLPQIGRTVGRTLGEFRRATSDLKRSMEVEMNMTEERETAAGNAPVRLAAASEPLGAGDAERRSGGGPGGSVAGSVPSAVPGDTAGPHGAADDGETTAAAASAPAGEPSAAEPSDAELYDVRRRAPRDVAPDAADGS